MVACKRQLHGAVSARSRSVMPVETDNSEGLRAEWTSRRHAPVNRATLVETRGAAAEQTALDIIHQHAKGRAGRTRMELNPDMTLLAEPSRDVPP